MLGLTCAVFLETLRHPPAAFLTRSASKNMAFGENAIEAVIGRGLASDHTSALVAVGGAGLLIPDRLSQHCDCEI